jgi:hypothetical protein
VFAPDDAVLIPERSGIREVGEVEHGVLARAIGVVARVQTARRPRREAARRWRGLARGEDARGRAVPLVHCNGLTILTAVIVGLGVVVGFLNYRK